MYYLLHNCETNKDSHGDPIILYNHKVIELNRKLIHNTKFNEAILLQYPIKESHKKLEKKN